MTGAAGAGATRTDAAAAADPRYPIGRFRFPEAADAAERARWTEDIAALPALLRAAVADLAPHQLDTPYRDGGWTVRQLVHHLADSHINALVRFRLALTEETPTIKPYDEARWAELPDARGAPVDPSLQLLDALHERWTVLLRSLAPEQWARGFRHPEHDRVVTLEQALAMYAWHGRHHVAHVDALRRRQGW